MMLVTIQPGPVLHVWRGGVEVACVPMTEPQALELMHELIGVIRWPQ